MTLYLYGVTSSEIASTLLAGSGSVDATVLDHFIDDAASKLNQEVIDALGGGDPSIITLADYPTDYAYLRSAVMKGAAAMYLAAVGGSNAAVSDRMADYRDTVTTVRKRPRVLQAARAIDSPNIPISHVTRMSSAKRARLSGRLDKPSNPRQWETL